MTPFVQKNDDMDEQPGAPTSTPSFDFDYISSKKIIEDNEGAIFEDDELGLSKIKDKKLLLIGLTSAIVVLLGALVYIMTREKSVDIEELPVIKADYQPIKERIENTSTAPSKDKKIYTYITATDEAETSKLKAKEPTLSIKELNQPKLTEADKKMIMKAFEDLAPNAKRRVRPTSVQPENKIVPQPNPTYEQPTYENEYQVPQQPIVQQTIPLPETPSKIKVTNNRPNTQNQARLVKKVMPTPAVQRQPKKKKSEALSVLIKEYSSAPKTSKQRGKTVKEGYYQTPTIQPHPAAASSNNGIYVQIASLMSHSEAKSEYNRIKRSHAVLNKFGHKIVTVRVGDSNRYRVMVGPFASKQAASRGVQEMKASGLRPLW